MLVNIILTGMYEIFEILNTTSKKQLLIFEPPHGKTNNVVSEQVRHKPACTSTEKS